MPINGIVMLVMFEHPENALKPIEVTLFGTMTLVMSVRLRNAFSLIEVIPLGIMISPLSLAGICINRVTGLLYNIPFTEQ